VSGAPDMAARAEGITVWSCRPTQPGCFRTLGGDVRF